MAVVPLATFTRGAVAESTHFGSIAVADQEGTLVTAVGDPDRMTTMRSAAKPFQAMITVNSGAADHFGFQPADLALIAGSHSGEPRHTTRVQHLLERAGLTVADLQTGVHAPFHEPTRARLQERGDSPTPLHHNCSGKHCGMLCVCVHQGWDTRTYYRPDHPVQRRIRQLMSQVTGLDRRAIAVAIDGCGVPTFATPLRAVAHAFAQLARPSSPLEAHAPAMERLRDAMVTHPEMVGGEGRFDTDLIRLGAGRILSKSGAEACHGVALLERGWGIAVKIEDGGSRAISLVVVEVLRQLGALSDREVEALGEHAHPLVRNFRHEIVGEGRAVFSLAGGTSR